VPLILFRSDDHKNLEYFMTAQKIIAARLGWSSSSLGLTSTSSIVLANPLAKPDLLRVVKIIKMGIEHDNENKILLNPPFLVPK